MNTQEQKLIALKVLLSVQDIQELSLHCGWYKSEKIAVSLPGNKDPEASLNIHTPFVKEISWLLHQFKYVFHNQQDDFIELCEGLKRKENELLSVPQTAEYLLKKSGKILQQGMHS